MDRHFFYEEIVDRPARRRILDAFMESIVYKSHKEMVKLTREAIKANKNDEALLVFFNWFMDEIKHDKSMRIVRQDDSECTCPQS